MRNVVLLTGTLTGLAMLMGSCSVVDWARPGRQMDVEYPPYEGVGYTERAPGQEERLVARDDFSVEVVALEDGRRPRTMERLPSDALIYQYDADELLGGVTYRLPVLLNKYLNYKAKAPKHYRVEVDLRDLKTVIATGTFFNGGSMGRYKVRLEAVAMARRPDSRVAARKTYVVELEQARRTFNGRSPTVELDRRRMYDLTEDAVRQMADELAWDIRQNDARMWRVEAAPPMPARLERVGPAVSSTRPLPVEPVILPPTRPLHGPAPAAPGVPEGPTFIAPDGVQG